MFPEPTALTADNIHTGLRASFERHIDENDILEFARFSGDANPLHINAEYAVTTNIGKPIVHGAFQIALASALIGMQLPGISALLASVQARFPSPLYYPSDVQVTGEIASWDRGRRSGSVRVIVTDQSSEIATAEIHVGFLLHEAARTVAATQMLRSAPQAASSRPAILLTGASGGIGAQLVLRLQHNFRVLALVRDPTQCEALLNAACDSQIVAADLESAAWQRQIDEALAGDSLYGIVHAAWPGYPQGSLLEIEERALEAQVFFGASVTVGLARYLMSHAAEKGGRFIALGSTAAVKKPLLQNAGYSLGKHTLEQTVVLLAPELARKQITANVVSPSFLAIGMNRRSTERQRLREAAAVPLGRLCEPGDIGAAIEFLLSPEASFISGQVLGLSGGML